ncbi:glycosyltransferase family 4 protein [Lihuaxuella thermophila]|uniref:Glycosyl transferases group 1 n=1 Tax=Lihuaxuella thermophila TaxID=1173111 RepID=A0A1H8DXY0_9BACL|nr:glycosyltransferase family 4 protein [Lihuaxuella thermophila]SEN12169.1 Glycosyl transferases group 1 [Lihuaxuella thermophila]
MKVVIPVGDLHIGGGCKVLVDIAHAFLERGHDAEIVMPQTGTVKYQLQSRLTIIPFLHKQYIPYGDIVLPNFYTTFRPSFEAWPKQCVRLSLGFEPFWVPDKREALWTYEQEVPIISISHWLDDQIYSHVKKRSKVINLGVDPSVFYPDSPESKFDRHKPKVILYIARPPYAYEFKGFNDFVECMKIVQQHYPGKFIVHLICPEYPLSLPGIPHKVFSPQNEIQMADLYRSADLFVSSSWFEAFSLPPLEAMACGTPVVTTNSGGILDFCTHMQSAYICPPQHPQSLAEGILTVLSDEKLAKKLIQGGLKVAQRLTKRNFEHSLVETLEMIYHERMAK